VIPLRDANPTQRMPYITLGLIVACFVVFAAELGLLASGGESSLDAFITRWGVVPAELTAAWRAGNYVSTETATLITSQFLHGGWFHLLGNMLYLWIFGNNVEDRFGRVRYLLFYLFCGYVAAYGFAYGNPHSTTTLVGASGAIAGVLGAYLVMFPRARVLTVVVWIPLRLPAWIVLGGWFLLQWLYSSGSSVASGAGVAYLAHVYGFVAGVLVAVLRRPRFADRGQYQPRRLGRL